VTATPLRFVATVLAVAAAALTGPSSQAASSALDTGFGVGGRAVVDHAGYDRIQESAVGTDGKIYAVGDFNLDGNGSYGAIVVGRNADGSRDAAFGERILSVTGYQSAMARAVAVQRDGKVLVAGNLGPPYDIGVWRLLPTGELDPSFGGGKGYTIIDSLGSEVVSDIATGPGGTVVVLGSTSADGGQAAVYRLTDTGAFDTSFDTDGALGVGGVGSDYGIAVGVQPDGKILLTGSFAGETSGTVRRLTATGPLDPTFGGGDGIADVPDTSAGLFDLALEADGSIVVAGQAPTPSARAGKVVKLTPSGALDAGFAGSAGFSLSLGGSEYFTRLALLPGGAVAAFGWTGINGDGLVVVLDAAGHLDTGFAEDGVFVATSLKVVPDAWDIEVQEGGKLLVVGNNGKDDQDAVIARLVGVTTSPPAVPTCEGRPATIVGSAGKDRLKGTAKADVIVALGGNDKVKGLGGDDVICGGDGNDTLLGAGGKDRLYGERGKDRLVGGTGKDRLVGGPDRDTTTQRS